MSEAGLIVVSGCSFLHSCVERLQSKPIEITGVILHRAALLQNTVSLMLSTGKGWGRDLHTLGVFCKAPPRHFNEGEGGGGVTCQWGQGYMTGPELLIYMTKVKFTVVMISDN